MTDLPWAGVPFLSLCLLSDFSLHPGHRECFCGVSGFMFFWRVVIVLKVETSIFQLQHFSLRQCLTQFSLTGLLYGLDQRSARDLELLFPKLEASSGLSPCTVHILWFPTSPLALSCQGTHIAGVLSLECPPPFVGTALYSVLLLLTPESPCFVDSPGPSVVFLVPKFMVDRIHASHTGSGTPRGKTDRSEIVLATSHLRKWEIWGYVIPETISPFLTA